MDKRELSSVLYNSLREHDSYGLVVYPNHEMFGQWSVILQLVYVNLDLDRRVYQYMAEALELISEGKTEIEPVRSERELLDWRKSSNSRLRIALKCGKIKEIATLRLANQRERRMVYTLVNQGLDKVLLSSYSTK